MKTIKGIKFNDVAFQYRMGAGFPGDINRTHPFSAAAALVDVDAPPTIYGQTVLVDASTQGVRRLGAGDASDSVLLTPYGAVVRPYPFQQQATSSYGNIALGVGTPPTSGVIDVLQAGYIMALINTGSTAPVKGGRVFVWCAATSGNHIQGGYETEASAGNTVQLDQRYTYQGGMDASNVAEISFNV